MNQHRIIILLALSALCLPVSAQFEQVRIKTTKVTDTIYMLEGAGGNIGVFTGTDGVLMIDAQFAPLSDKIIETIDTLSPAPIRFLVNTSWHDDHTGGNLHMAAHGARIVAHENVRKRLSTEQFVRPLGKKYPASAPEALPKITFRTHMDFYFNGEEIRIIHHPRGHTDGDALVYFVNSNVIHTGDLVFNGSYPFIDTSSGGSLDGVILATEQILKLCDDNTKIIPGRGPLATRADVQAYHTMLVGVRKVLYGFLEQRLTLPAVELKNPLKEYNDKWGKGYITPALWLKIVYQDLAEK